jgi:hypothetical protein
MTSKQIDIKGKGREEGKQERRKGEGEEFFSYSVQWWLIIFFF